MNRRLVRLAGRTFLGVLSVPYAFLMLPLAAISRLFRRDLLHDPRYLLGSTPIISSSLWCKALINAGRKAETFTFDFYSSINTRKDWGRILSEEYRYVPAYLKPYIAFIECLFKYDIVVMSCDGLFIGTTPAWRLQALAFSLANIRTVVFPYGADAYVYRRVRSMGLMHGLLASYPNASRLQKRIAARVDYWCAHADMFVPGIMSPDGYGRSDIVCPSQIHLDVRQWTVSERLCEENYGDGVVRIAHAPNHRGFKGTEFVIAAVQQLQAEGLRVELILLEKIQNDELRRILRSDVDILVEQIVATGHGLNALEGMATGLPVVSNLEDDDYILPFRRWSFFSECPLVSASPENLVDVLRALVKRPQLRIELGRAGRQYVEKYHGLDAAVFLFNAINEYFGGKRESVYFLYHPLTGEYKKSVPLVENPLKFNRISN